MDTIKAVLFDLDGVLIEAKDWHYEALNKALKLFGLEISRYDHLATYDGLPTKKKLEMLSLERGLPRELHQFINRIKQRYTMDEIYQKCKPTFIHEYALSKLKRDGYLMGVCSNSIRNTVEVALDKAMIVGYFDLLLSSDDVKQSKPNPEVYTTCMSRLGVKPSETLILEDNENGIQAALASGAHLLRIDTVKDVTYENILQAIDAVQGKVKKAC